MGCFFSVFFFAKKVGSTRSKFPKKSKITKNRAKKTHTPSISFWHGYIEDVCKKTFFDLNNRRRLWPGKNIRSLHVNQPADQQYAQDERARNLRLVSSRFGKWSFNLVASKSLWMVDGVQQYCY